MQIFHYKLPDSALPVSFHFHTDPSPEFWTKLRDMVETLPVLTREALTEEGRVIHAGQTITSILPQAANMDMGYSSNSLATAAGIYVSQHEEYGLARPGIIIPEYLHTPTAMVPHNDVQGVGLHEAGHFLLELNPEMITDRRFTRAYREGCSTAHQAIKLAPTITGLQVAPPILHDQTHSGFGPSEVWCNSFVNVIRGVPYADAINVHFGQAMPTVAKQLIDRGFAGEGELREVFLKFKPYSQVVQEFDKILQDSGKPPLRPLTVVEKLRRDIANSYWDSEPEPKPLVATSVPAKGDRQGVFQRLSQFVRNTR